MSKFTTRRKRFITGTELLILAICGLMLTFAPVTSHAAPALYTTDFINDATRTHFNGFEAIPNFGGVYTGGNGPYIENGIKVEQMAQPVFDGQEEIYVGRGAGFTSEGVHAWYPNGGDFGFTDITMSDGSAFDSVGFYAGTGGPDAQLIYFDILLHGISIMSGSTSRSNYGQLQYIGFSGGGFDELRVRDSILVGNNFYDGGSNALSLDGIETTGSAPVPEPSTIFLLGTGLACLGLIRRRAQK